MLMPTLFDRDFFNDFFDDPFFGSKDMKKMEKKMNSRRAQNLMKTDVRETADAYEMKVELPGFKKENVKISLENGYLTIYAEKNSEEEKGGRFIRGSVTAAHASAASMLAMRSMRTRSELNSGTGS